MSADKLGRYMAGDVFLGRANAAVAGAVSKLEAKGVKPVYLDRRTGRIVGHSDGDSCANDICEGQQAPDLSSSEDPMRGDEE